MKAHWNTIAFALALGCGLPAQQPQRAVLALPAGEQPATALALPAADPADAKECAARARARLQSVDERQCNALARGKALEPGIEPRYRLLRDEIGFDSYSGVLRGAQGTYAQRAGNALDRSLLLAELLRQQGMTVRFARGRLDQAHQEQLVRRLLALPAASDPALATAGPALQALLARVRARAGRDFTALRTALGDRVPAPEPAPEALRAEVQDHFWVQVQQGEQWLDLDPAFADLKPGQRATAPEQTWEQIPASLHQTAVVRVLVETLVDQALRSETALEETQPVVQWIDRQVFVLQVPQENLGSGVAGALQGKRGSQWRPTLVVDGELHQGTAVDCRADVAGGGALGAFDTGTQPATGTATGPGTPVFVAEWLEVELRFPDGRVELHRRALVDRAGPQLRNQGTFTAAQLQPLPRDAGGPLFAKDAHQVVFSSSRHDMHDYAEALVDLTEALAAPAAANQSQQAPGLEALWPFALQSFGWMFITDERLLPALNDLQGVRLYADAPRVWIASVVHGSRNGGDEFVLDLRRDKLRGVCEPGRARALSDRKLWFAALAGALEHELLADLAVRVGVEPKLVATTSATVDGSDLLVMAPSDLAKAAMVTAAQPAAHVAAALQRGSLVVVSRAAAAGDTTSFWEVDQQGDTRPVYGLDWNGAAVPTPRLLPGLGGGGPSLPLPPRPSYSNGGGYLSQVARGGKAGSNFRRVGPPPRGGGTEYAALLVCVLALSLEFFVLGVAVAWAAGYV